MRGTTSGIGRLSNKPKGARDSGTKEGGLQRLSTGGFFSVEKREMRKFWRRALSY